MKDEIKEILDELDWYIKQPNNQDINGEYEPPMELSQEEAKDIYDCITNLQEKVEQYENPDDLTLITMYCDLKAKDKIKQLQEENDYLKDIVSNTELSDEIKKADKWSKRELYKINYQRLQVNKRLREENERLKKPNYYEKGLIDSIKERDEIIQDYKSRCEKARELVKKIDNFDINADKCWNDLLNILNGGDDNE